MPLLTVDRVWIGCFYDFRDFLIQTLSYWGYLGLNGRGDKI